MIRIVMVKQNDYVLSYCLGIIDVVLGYNARSLT